MKLCSSDRCDELYSYFKFNLFMKPNWTYIGNQTKNFVFNILIKKVPFSYLDNLFKDEYSIDDLGH